MTTQQPNLATPSRLAKRGEAIYREHHQATMEANHIGKVVAIDLMNEKCCHVEETAAEAIRTARANAPNGFFYLIRVGSVSVTPTSDG